MKPVNSIIQASMSDVMDQSIYDSIVIESTRFVHVTLSAKGKESLHHEQLFILCPATTRNAVPIAQLAEVTCPECQVLAAVVLANGLKVKTNPQAFRRKLRSLLK